MCTSKLFIAYKYFFKKKITVLSRLYYISSRKKKYSFLLFVYLGSSVCVCYSYSSKASISLFPASCHTHAPENLVQHGTFGKGKKSFREILLFSLPLCHLAQCRPFSLLFPLFLVPQIGRFNKMGDLSPLSPSVV